MSKTPRMLAIATLVLLVLGGGVAFYVFKGPDLSTPERSAEALVAALNRGDVSTLKKIYGESMFQDAAKMCAEMQQKPEPSGSFVPQFFIEEWRGNREHDCANLEREFRAFVAKLPSSAGLTIHSVRELNKEVAAVYIEPPDYSPGSRLVDEVVMNRQPDGRWVPHPVIRYRSTLRWTRFWERSHERASR